jgi:hypothetical protein
MEIGGDNTPALMAPAGAPGGTAVPRPLNPAGDLRRRGLRRVAAQVSIPSGDSRLGMSEYLTDDR